MATGQRVKCRYCPWNAALWYRGAAVGWRRLQEHVKDAHRAEAIALEEAAGRFYGDILDEPPVYPPGIEPADPDWSEDEAIHPKAEGE